MDVLELLNGLACLVLFLGLSVLILHPGVHDGIVIKAGLVMLALGELGVAMLVLGGQLPPVLRPIMLCMLSVHMGLAVVLAGVVLRVVRDPQARRAAHALSGWPPLDEART